MFSEVTTINLSIAEAEFDMFNFHAFLYILRISAARGFFRPEILSFLVFLL